MTYVKTQAKFQLRMHTLLLRKTTGKYYVGWQASGRLAFPPPPSVLSQAGLLLCGTEAPSSPLLPSEPEAENSCASETDLWGQGSTVPKEHILKCLTKKKKKPITKQAK